MNEFNVQTEYRHFGRIDPLRIEEWEQVYSPLNVIGELAKMEQWLDANPRRRKKNYLRFIVNWLSRAHSVVLTSQTIARVQAKTGEQTGKVGCWVDGRLEE